MLNTHQDYSMVEHGNSVNVFSEEQRNQLIKQQKRLREELMSEQIDAFGTSISKLRDDAVAYRKNSGIEDLWRRCEEAYLGIDDANRHEFEGQSWAKPMTMDSPLSRESRGSNRESPKSTVFVKITSRYVDGSAARLGDILLPVDDKPFTANPTPVPDLEEVAEDQTPVQHPKTGEQMPNPETKAPLTYADIAKKKIATATEKALKAETRVWDWMAECGYGGELRKVIHDAARLGVGVIKGPIPMSRIVRKVSSEQGMAMSFSKEIKPGSVWIDPWNFYPHGACGENVRNGSYTWERDSMSAKQLQDLKDQPGYLSSQIDKVLKEGPGKRNIMGATSYGDKESAAKDQFEVWHFYGEVSRKELSIVDAVGVDDLDEEDGDKVPAILTMVNDSVVRATLNPMESGDFPYDTMSWKRRSGSWAGVGVAEDLFSPQRIVNGATRAMLDNGGLSAGAQVVVDKGAIYPADGSWVITPNKIWNKSEESPTSDVRQAFTTFTIPSVQAEMMNMIQYGLRMAEESAGLPLVSQGQTSENNTYGQDQLQQNNANTLLRRVGKSFDDGITTPHVNRYYEWLMMDPSVPDEEKGDFKWVVHGSSALIERAIQDQSLMMMGQMTANPAFRIDPAKWFAEMCRSKFMDPSRLQYSDEEFEEMQKTQQPPPMPQIEVAKIRADIEGKKLQANMAQSQAEMQLEREIAQIENQTMQTRIKVDTDRDTALVTAQHEKNQNDANLRMQELTIKRELALLEYANAKQMTLEQIKSDLARDSMKLNVQKELAGAAHEMDIHKHHNPSPQVVKPLVEPQGRAPAGQAFQK